MGIPGLFNMFKECIDKKHITNYRGLTVGIDGHSWIHKVIPFSAVELYNNIPTDAYAKRFMKMISGLISYGIKPIVVFDGDPLETKQKTVDERRKRREIIMEKIEVAISKNDHHTAQTLMPRCVRVTVEILHKILLELRKNSIEYIVSPYEADPQLVILQKIKYIDWIISEDSDLVVYGADRVLFKFDGTHVDEYRSSKLHLTRNQYLWKNITDIVILSGCDYVSSLDGVGLVTAQNVWQKTGTVKYFINHMRTKGKKIPPDYEENVTMAKKTFLYHIVYNPITNRRLHLNDMEDKHDFPGTLTDVPLIYRTSFGVELSFPRHHVPGKTEDEALDISLEADF